GTCVEIVALQAVVDVIVSKRPVVRIEPGDSFPGAEPKPAVPIIQNALNDAAGQALIHRVLGKRFVLAVIPVQSIQGSQPQCSVPVFVDVPNAATTDWVSVTGVGFIVHQGVGLVVESAQCAHPRPEPERPRPVLIDGSDTKVAQARQ